MKKRQMTLGKRLVSLDNPNKLQLIFNLNPRIIFSLLKCERIAFQKTTKVVQLDFSFFDVFFIIQLKNKKTYYAIHTTETIKEG